MKKWQIEKPTLPNFTVEWKYHNSAEWNILPSERFGEIFEPYIGYYWKNINEIIATLENGLEVKTISFSVRRSLNE